MAALSFDPRALPSPCFVVDERLMRRNLELLRHVADEAGCKILLAQKAFSMFSLYPLIGQYLDGTTASGLNEARLGGEHMGKETHVFAPAYPDADFEALLRVCDHVVFNSFAQLWRFRARALAAGKRLGIRINPEHSTQSRAIYDPCAPGSRLGVTAANFEPDALEGVSGLHFHTLCEQNADALCETLDAVEEKFGQYFDRLEWLNMGGGHHITRPDYDVAALVRRIRAFRARYGLEVYLEPGEAVALNAGFLVATVLDIVHNGIEIAILDTSATCHMPDVIEAPYRPEVIGAGLPGEKPHTYRLAGLSCLAGDVVGDYAFDRPLGVGDRVIFTDMAIYSMVKTNTFNGVGLPSIAIAGEDGAMRLVRRFGYEDFRDRLS